MKNVLMNIEKQVLHASDKIEVIPYTLDAIQMPCTLTPEQILEGAPKKSRSVPLDPNVIAYFGDLILNMNAGVRRIAIGANGTPVASSSSKKR